MQIAKKKLRFIMCKNGKCLQLNDKIWIIINSHNFIRTKITYSVPTIWKCKNCGMVINTGTETIILKENRKRISYPKTCSEMIMKLACE